jgi:DNA-binding FrmR family transcriptional regulator
MAKPLGSNMSHEAHQHKKTELVVNRLSRIEGHVRAIKQMVQVDKPCPDVLIQLAAVKAAIQKTAQVVLEDHIESCLIKADIGDPEWASLKEALDKYIT